MKCPTDDSTLVMSERSGIEIDYCPTCRGVWLDRGELDKIIERSLTQPPAAAPPPEREQPRYEQPREEPRYEQPRYDQGHDQGRDQRSRDYDRRQYPKKRKESWLSELFD